ncbi:MAG TPA: ATP-dependent helicase, partial [Flavobacteriales bacterium]|nr:ATP-dependent helicase [Flavobacteriales bacterium]
SRNNQHRIGNILKNTDALPYNILCLTYTEAGTIAMRKQLQKFIGPAAYRVSIYTFHAFCNDIIQRNPAYFGNRELEPISELETVDLLMKLLDGLDASNPLKRLSGQIYYDVPLMKDLFRKMKEESWTPEYIGKCIDSYLEDLPLRDAFIYKKANSKKDIQAGDVKQHLIDKEADKMTKLREASQLFSKYRELMKRNNRYDYNDMILWVLEAFKKDEDFLRIQQEKYLYFLVDEYQDTNGAQNELLNFLINYWDKPNVFTVGDDDQSIFEFQGARMRNIMDFYEAYRDDMKVILMEDNYRSSQHILDASRMLIENNNERLVNRIEGLQKVLTAKNDEVASSDIHPEIISYYNIKHQEASIVDEIEELHKNGAVLNEIAVIFFRHRQAEEIINTMEKKGIPYNVTRKINILELPLIQNLIKILDYINLETQRPHSAEHHLFEIMHFNFLGLSSRDAAKIMYYSGSDWKLKLREVLTDKDALEGLNLESLKAVSEFEREINHWIQESANTTLQALFEKIINRGGVLKEIMNSPDKTWLMQVLISFFDFIKEESMKNAKLSLKVFLQTLEKMELNKIPINVNRTVFQEDGVNFVTAHSSKGLEFQRVFLIGCNADVWDKKGRSYAYSLPDTLTQTNLENMEESARRVFFVAMTRAKEHLHISYAARNNKGKDLEKSLYVAELLEGSDLKIEEKHLSTERITELSMEGLTELILPKADLLDTDFISAKLENYSLSVTHLNKYLECPVAYYYSVILRVPAAKNDSMAFGSAVHWALKSLFDKMQESGKDKFPPKEELVSDFMFDMRRNEASFNEQQFKRRKELGQEILPAYYDKYVNTWNRVVVSEYNITNVEMDGIPLNGKLDKMEFNNREVNVVDYKTGKVENGLKKLRPPSDKDPLGGDYWRQVVFYKILMDELRPKKWTMVSGEIDFIERATSKEKDFVKREIVVERGDIIIVKEQIRQTWDNIIGQKFEVGCNKEECAWCNFVKNQYVSKESLAVETEEEDIITT